MSNCLIYIIICPMFLKQNLKNSICDNMAIDCYVSFNNRNSISLYFLSCHLFFLTETEICLSIYLPICWLLYYFTIQILLIALSWSSSTFTSILWIYGHIRSCVCFIRLPQRKYLQYSQCLIF